MSEEYISRCTTLVQLPSAEKIVTPNTPNCANTIARRSIRTRERGIGRRADRTPMI
jgi:predicted RNA-binding Zn-ribbon protein involved in translation (DUF1610 family)